MKIVYDMANGTIQSDEARDTRDDNGCTIGHEAQLHLALQEIPQSPDTDLAPAARMHIIQALCESD